MTEPQYGEPWTREGQPATQYILSGGRNACEWIGRPQELNRAVACVNALAGLNPDDVKRRLEERDELLEWFNRLDHAYALAKAAIAKAEG